MRVLIAGSGTWGTALAHVARQAGADVTIHCRRRERAEELARGEHGLFRDFSLGAGFGRELESFAIRVDYAYTDFGVFDGVNRLSLGVSF